MITEEEYQKFLEPAPYHNSEEFISFLRDNNTVVHEDDSWIVVENIKYHTKEKPWLTAFLINQDGAVDASSQLAEHFGSTHRIMLQPPSLRSIQRFHVHLLDAEFKYTV